ncbi:hypothetical protein AHAS_Ahas07G0116800 [Arachis hypogaea]
MDDPNIICLKHHFFSTISTEGNNSFFFTFHTYLAHIQIFMGLAYIHTILGVWHRNLKPQNILIGLISFLNGLYNSNVILVFSLVDLITNRLRYFYRTPEFIFSATEYATSTDIWSTGCVLTELLLGLIYICFFF